MALDNSDTDPHSAAARRAPARVGQRGAAALEFTLIALPLMVLVGLIVSLGALFLIKQNLARAAGEGARALVVGTHQPGAAALDPCEVARQVLRDTSGWLGAAVDCSAPAGTASCGPGELCEGYFIVRYAAAGDSRGAYTLLQLAPMLVRLIGTIDGIDNHVLSRFLAARAIVRYSPTYP